MKPAILKGLYRLAIAIILFSFSCTEKTKDQPWSDIRIDPTVSQNAVFQQLDQQEEIPSFPEIPDSLIRRTSAVMHYTGEEKDSLKNPYAKLNNCRAYLDESDNLILTIGQSDGLTAHGFEINCKDGRFYTKAYLMGDAIFEDEKEPVQLIRHQNLTLNRATYAIDDSLYGNVDFKLLEVNPMEDTVTHFGKGYFRTKVKPGFRKK